MNVIEALENVALNKPKTIGLKIPSRNITGHLHYQEKTFQQMDHNVNLLATYLLVNGFSKGQKVILMLPPGEDLLTTVFAMLRLGAVPIVIDPGMGFKNLINCVKQSTPDLFLGTPKARIFYYLLRCFVKFKKALFLSQHLKIELKKKNFACRLPNDNSSQQLAAVLFTSGSTGYPKGAVYTYNDFNEQIKALQTTFQIFDGEVDLPLLPVFSLYNPALGMTTVVPEMNPSHPSALNPQKIVESILKCKVTNSFGSPRLWTKIVDYCEKNDILLPSIKRIFLAGAPVHPILLKRVQALIPHGQAFTPYGATEALPIAYISAKEVLNETYEKTFQGYGTCVGHPIKGVKIRIIPIDDKTLNKLPEELKTGEIGEIAVSAPYISKSYLNNPSATTQAKILHQGEIWHRMGDLGYKDENARLWFCGRKVERVQSIRGTFFTDCCEAIFNTHKDVFRSALIGFCSDTGIVPAIVIEPNKNLQNKHSLFIELRALGRTYPCTKYIEHFCIFKKFPVDVRHNAKIHRLSLTRYFNEHPKFVKHIP